MLLYLLVYILPVWIHVDTSGYTSVILPAWNTARICHIRSTTTTTTFYCTSCICKLLLNAVSLGPKVGRLHYTTTRLTAGFPLRLISRSERHYSWHRYIGWQWQFLHSYLCQLFCNAVYDEIMLQICVVSVGTGKKTLQSNATVLGRSVETPHRPILGRYR